MNRQPPPLPDHWQDLRQAARDVRERAYAPYSRFQVGAALRTSTGEIYRGCNVENASYGGTICAERMAVGAAVAAGDRDITTICISLTGVPVPCGICRQFLYEFHPDMVILVDDLNAENRDEPPESVWLSDLLPRGFRLEN